MERDRKTEIEKKGTEIKRWERDRADVDCRGRVETVLQSLHLRTWQTTGKLSVKYIFNDI